MDIPGQGHVYPIASEVLDEAFHPPLSQKQSEGAINRGTRARAGQTANTRSPASPHGITQTKCPPSSDHSCPVPPPASETPPHPGSPPPSSKPLSFTPPPPQAPLSHPKLHRRFPQSLPTLLEASIMHSYFYIGNCAQCCLLHI